MSRPPEPTAQDLRHWAALVRTAKACAADPEAFAGDLARAAKAARRSIVIGVLSKDNAFVRLVRASRTFVDATKGQRVREAADLAALAAAAETILKAHPPRGSASPAPRARVDIDG